MKVVYHEITCPRCKGKGLVIDHEDGVFTLGIGYFFQAIDKSFRPKCPKCGGSGTIYRKTIVVEE